MLKNPLQKVEYWPMAVGPKFKIYAHAARKNLPPRLTVRRALHDHIAGEINHFYTLSRAHDFGLDELWTQLILIVNDQDLVIDFVPENSPHVRRIEWVGVELVDLDEEPPLPHLRAVVGGRQFMFSPVKCSENWL